MKRYGLLMIMLGVMATSSAQAWWPWGQDRPAGGRTPSPQGAILNTPAGQSTESWRHVPAPGLWAAPRTEAELSPQQRQVLNDERQRQAAIVKDLQAQMAANQRIMSQNAQIAATRAAQRATAPSARAAAARPTAPSARPSQAGGTPLVPQGRTANPPFLPPAVAAGRPQAAPAVRPGALCDAVTGQPLAAGVPRRPGQKLVACPGASGAAQGGPQPAGVPRPRTVPDSGAGSR